MAEESQDIDQLTQTFVHSENYAAIPEPIMEDDDIEMIPAVDSVAAYLSAPIVIDISRDEESAINDDGNSDSTMELELNTPKPVMEAKAVKIERQETPAPWFNQVVDVIRWLARRTSHTSKNEP